MRMRRPPPPSRPAEQGVAVIELALVLPLLLLLSLLTTEMGRAFYHYGVLTQSVREGVRHLSRQLPGQGVATARNLVVYGNPEGTGAPVLPGLAAVQVESSWQFVGAAPPMQVVTLRVSGYQFNSLVGTVWGVQTLGSLSFGEISASMRAEP